MESPAWTSISMDHITDEIASDQAQLSANPIVASVKVFTN